MELSNESLGTLGARVSLLTNYSTGPRSWRRWRSWSVGAAMISWRVQHRQPPYARAWRIRISSRTAARGLIVARACCRLGLATKQKVLIPQEWLPESWQLWQARGRKALINIPKNKENHLITQMASELEKYIYVSFTKPIVNEALI